MTTTPIAEGPNDVTVRTRFEQWYLRDLRGNPANLELDENGEYKYLPTLLLAFAAGEKTEREAWISCADRMPEPDMVMVPREPTEAMLDAAMNRYQHVSPEAKARYTQMHRENFRCDYKAMIAAAEKE